MRRCSPSVHRTIVAIAALFAASLAIVTTAAQAAVVQDGSNVAGVALVPLARQWGETTQSYLSNASIPLVTSGGNCADPASSTEPDILKLGWWPTNAPAQPICWHGGPVMHANETFTLEWEGQSPNSYWATTKSYVQNFLGDVAAASGQLVNPYSDTTQYWDNSRTDQNNPASARAAYDSVFGGGCDDNGTANCRFGSITGSGLGNSLPAAPGDCPVTGDNIDGGTFGGGPVSIANNLCVTDADIQNEVTTLVQHDNLIAHTQPGHTPLVTVLTPPGVVVCLDSGGRLCSVNSLLAPPPPVLDSAATGGQVTAGAYQVVVTYETSGGSESAPSAPASITTSGSTSTLTIYSPPSHSGVTGWYAYVTGPNGAIYARQTTASNSASGGLNSIGQPLTLTLPPSSGPTPPTGPAAFCSYHSKDPQVLDPTTGQPVSYVVQPWSAFTMCDEPDVPTVPPYAAPSVVEKSAGQRLVSPLSQSSMAAIVNPQVSTGWFGLDGLEIDDQNACQPYGHGLDTFNFGSSGGAPYYLQRESNNASVVDNDPWTYDGCLPSDVLNPSFVAPSAVDQGDTVAFDGSATASSLGIPNANYSWNFGDGTTGTGPSVVHSFGNAGTYNVTLTTTDRGGNTQTLTQTIQVLGPGGQPAPAGAPATTTSASSGSGSGSSGSGSGSAAGSALLSVRLQLLPQSLKSVLRSGIAVRVSSNEAANGIATVSITRAAARRAHIKVGRARMVRIGLGTVSSITNGTVRLRLHLSRAMAKKLAHLIHVDMTVRLALVAAGNQRFAIDAAGRY